MSKSDAGERGAEPVFLKLPHLGLIAFGCSVAGSGSSPQGLASITSWTAPQNRPDLITPSQFLSGPANSQVYRALSPIPSGRQLASFNRSGLIPSSIFILGIFLQSVLAGGDSPLAHLFGSLLVGALAVVTQAVRREFQTSFKDDLRVAMMAKKAPLLGLFPLPDARSTLSQGL